MSIKKPKPDESPRQNRARAAGEIVAEVGGMAFRRFGFIQSSVVSRWGEIVGDRYARVSSPESIRFPAGQKSGGVLTLLVEGAHAPVMQHLAPDIVERVNRFFGYPAVARVSFRQGRPAPEAKRPERPNVGAVPKALGEGLRQIADPELRTCLEALAASLSASTGAPVVDQPAKIAIPVINRRI